MIKSLRIREDMTQGALAQKLNLSRSSISMYENNERKPPTELLAEIADLFNVDMNYITGRMDKEYYLDLKTRQIAQEILNNSEIRALFDASRGATPEDLEITKNLLISLKNKERGGSID